MKILLMGLLFISCFACNSKPDTSKRNTASASRPSNDHTTKLINKFKPILQGVWVRADYVKNLLTTKSPYSSFKYLRGVASMNIDFKQTAKDSLTIGYSLNNHEGADFMLVFKKGVQPNSLITKLELYEPGHFYHLGYRISKRDTTLIFYHYSNNNKLLESTTFVRLFKHAPINHQDDIAYGLSYITNKLLITGTYTSIDSTGKSQSIKFDSEGNVYGFPAFKNYSVATDFEAGPENNLDVIYFNNDGHTSLAYQIKKDTLTLFSTRENDDHTLILRDKQRYQMIRTR